MRHFSEVDQHPLVLWLDSELKRERCASTRMSGFAFVFDSSGLIRRSPICSSTNFVGQGNTLLPVLVWDSLRIGQMRDWLRRQFPNIDFYDHVNVIFSPLVWESQSLTCFQYTGLSELQSHVNFGCDVRWSGDDRLDLASIRLRRGATVADLYPQIVDWFAGQPEQEGSGVRTSAFQHQRPACRRRLTSLGDTTGRS